MTACIGEDATYYNPDVNYYQEDEGDDTPSGTPYTSLNVQDQHDSNVPHLHISTVKVNPLLLYIEKVHVRC